MTKKKQYKKSRTHKKARGGKLLSFIHSIPAWTIWGGAIFVAVVYVLAFHILVSKTTVRWKGQYGPLKTPSGYKIHGLDVSHYQGVINWEKLRNATVNGNSMKFILIKGTEGCTLFDENFNDNFYRARENGFVRGAYHFYAPGVSAEEQAVWFLRQVHLESGDLPPILDVESKSPNLSDEMFKKEVSTWLTRVGSYYGVKPILYTSYSFKLRYLNDSVFNTYPYWIAHYYVDSLQYKGEWAFWQYTDCGKVNGIKGKVDLDVFSGTMDNLQQLCIRKSDFDSRESLYGKDDEDEDGFDF